MFEDFNGDAQVLFDADFVPKLLSACKRAVEFIKYDNPKSTAKCKKYQDFKNAFVERIKNFKGDKLSALELYLEICKIRGEARGW